MKTYIFLIILILILSALFLFSCQNKTKSQSQNCFDKKEFEAIYNYAIWKNRTSKIGKLLVNGYRVEVDKNNKTLIFKKDKEDYTIFKVNVEKGIILLPIKQTKRLENKVNKIYCELIKRARLHPVPPQK